MAEAKATPRNGRKRRAKKAVEPRGLTARQVPLGTPAAPVSQLAAEIVADEGAVLSVYREPLGGRWQILAVLPIDRVSPTPYQRDLSETHVARLADAIDKLDRFIDPVVVTRTEDGHYWTPNGNHRLAALRALGAVAIMGIVVPERAVAHRILALNTEKAHNVRERALEVIRLAEALASLDDRPERDYAAEFEEPALLTLGLCYQENGLRGRVSSGAQKGRGVSGGEIVACIGRAPGSGRALARTGPRRDRCGPEAQSSWPGKSVSQGIRPRPDQSAALEARG